MPIVNLQGGNTISFDQSINFIKNDLSLGGGNNDKIFSNISGLQKMRNRFMHSMFSYSIEQVEACIEKSLFEINNLSSHYEIKLIDKIDSKLKLIFKQRIYGYQKAVREATKKAAEISKKINDENDDGDIFSCVGECPGCFNNTFLIYYEDRIGKCNFCPYKEDVMFCAECEDPFPFSKLHGYYRRKYICEGCLDENKKQLNQLN